MKLSGTKAGRRIGLRLPAPPRFKRPSRGKLILLAVCALLTLACVALCFVYSATAGTLLSQQAAERYRGENEQRFAQATSFFPAGAEKGIQDIRTFRQGMDGKLLDVSLEAPEGAPALWFDAYSGTGELTVTGSKGTATVPATGVGGEWFSFHPLELRSGGYITEDELMHDRVILDEKLAWQLFGGYDLAGLTVTISGKPYVIAGVVAMEDDRASARAHETNGEIFLHFDALQQLTGGDGSGGISCYELVCAEPISGFTLGLLTEGFKSAVTVQNTGRFSVKNELGLLRNFGTRSMQTSGVVYPYWENAARLNEDSLALVLTGIILTALLPFVMAAVLVVKLARRGWLRLRYELVPDTWERISDRVRAKQQIALRKRQKRIEEKWVKEEDQKSEE